VGTATAGQTGQRKWGDHRVGRGEAGQPQTENLSTKGKAEMQAWFYANSVLCLLLASFGNQDPFVA
jgi:hypothetical protein